MKRVFTNAGDTVGDGYVGKSLAAPECAFTNAGYAVGDGNADELVALIECVFTNAAYAVWDSYAGQIEAIIECVFTNASDAVGDGHASQGSTIRERTVTNSGDSVGNHYIPAESTGKFNQHTVTNDEGRVRRSGAQGQPAHQKADRQHQRQDSLLHLHFSTSIFPSRQESSASQKKGVLFDISRFMQASPERTAKISRPIYRIILQIDAICGKMCKNDSSLKKYTF